MLVPFVVAEKKYVFIVRCESKSDLRIYTFLDINNNNNNNKLSKGLESWGWNYI